MMKKLLTLTLILAPLAFSQVTPSRQRVQFQTEQLDTVRGNHPLNNQWLTFQYFVPSHYTNVLWTDATLHPNFEWVEEPGSQWPNIYCYESVFTTPSNDTTNLAMDCRTMVFTGPDWPIGWYETLQVDFEAWLWSPYYADTVWLKIGDWVYNNDGRTIDTTIASMSINFRTCVWQMLEHAYDASYQPTFYTFGMSPGELIHFRIRAGHTKPIRPDPSEEELLETTIFTPNYYWYIPDEWKDQAYFWTGVVWDLGDPWKAPSFVNKQIFFVRSDLNVSGDLTLGSALTVHNTITGDIVQSLYEVIAGSAPISNDYTQWPGTEGTYTLFGPTKDRGYLRGSHTKETQWTLPDLPETMVVDTIPTFFYLPKVAGGSRVQIIKGKNNIQVTQSGDTTYFEANSSATGGGSYITSPGDKPPDSVAVSSFNDEFNFSTIDTTTKWTWRNRGATTFLAAQQSFCVLSDTGVPVTNNWRIIEQTITDTTFSVTTKISYASKAAAFNNVGLIVLDSTNGRLLNFGPAEDASNCYIQLNKYNSVTSYNSSPYSQVVNKTGLTGYYRMRKDAAKKFYADISQDGVMWANVWSEAGSTFIESSGKVNRIGVGVNANGASVIANGAFWFFRYNWTADFDATIDN